MVVGEQNIVVGALVQWTGAKTYGVITERDERTIYVRWDIAGPPPQFVIGDPPLIRVALHGQRVRLMSTGENAAVLEPRLQIRRLEMLRCYWGWENCQRARGRPETRDHHRPRWPI